MVLVELDREEISLGYVSDILLRRQPEKNFNSVYTPSFYRRIMSLLSAPFHTTVLYCSSRSSLLLFIMAWHQIRY